MLSHLIATLLLSLFPVCVHVCCDPQGDDDEDAEAAAFARELRVSGAATRDGTEKGFVELLRARHLSVGCRIWGMVLSVTSREVEVSLPNGLRGRIVPTEVCVDDETCASMLMLQLTSLLCMVYAWHAVAAVSVDSCTLESRVWTHVDVDLLAGQ